MAPPGQDGHLRYEGARSRSPPRARWAAAAVFIATRLTSGAWVAVLAGPALMLLFSRIQGYYQAVGSGLELGAHPPRPEPARSLVIVPAGSVSKLTR